MLGGGPYTVAMCRLYIYIYIYIYIYFTVTKVSLNLLISTYSKHVPNSDSILSFSVLDLWDLGFRRWDYVVGGILC